MLCCVSGLTPTFCNLSLKTVTWVISEQSIFSEYIATYDLLTEVFFFHRSVLRITHSLELQGFSTTVMEME